MNTTPPAGVATGERRSDPGDTIDEARRVAERLDLASASALLPDGPPEAATARRFPGYRLLEEIGRGGQGSVFLALQERTGRKVALKVLHRPLAAAHPRSTAARALRPPRPPDSRSTESRLEREARILCQITDDGICPVLDYVHDSTPPFVVMRYVEGESLADRIALAGRRRRAGAGAAEVWSTLAPSRAEPDTFSWSRSSAPISPLAGPLRGDLRAVLRLLEEVALSLDVAHEHGVVHRDVKPGNILLRRDGRPVIVDFGLALDLSTDARLTRSGEPVGTPAYMAPEQVRQGPIDRRADVYGLGAVLYELLTLQRPFHGPTPGVIYTRILAGVPHRLQSFDPGLPRDLEAVCLKALDPDPGRRYPTTRAFAEDLRRVRALQPTVARPLSPLARFRRQVVRHPSVAANLALTVACLVLAAMLAHAHAQQAEEAPAAPPGATVEGE